MTHDLLEAHRSTPLARLHPLELQVMRLDGELVANTPDLGHGVEDAPDHVRYSAPDEPLSRGDRMRMIAPHVHAGFVVAGSTAAWVYDGLVTSRQLEFFTPTRRPARQEHNRVRVRYRRVRAADITMIANRCITTPARTLFDLALDEAPSLRLLEFEASLAAQERDLLPGDLESCARRLRGAQRARLTLVAHLASARAAFPELADDAVHVVDTVDAPHGTEQPVEVRRVTHLE